MMVGKNTEKEYSIPRPTNCAMAKAYTFQSLTPFMTSSLRISCAEAVCPISADRKRRRFARSLAERKEAVSGLLGRTKGTARAVRTVGIPFITMTVLLLSLFFEYRSKVEVHTPSPSAPPAYAIQLTNRIRE
jgi:hypothetical protein